MLNATALKKAHFMFYRFYQNKKTKTTLPGPLPLPLPQIVRLGCTGSLSQAPLKPHTPIKFTESPTRQTQGCFP